jgi:hypothetical protein
LDQQVLRRESSSGRRGKLAAGVRAAINFKSLRNDLRGERVLRRVISRMASWALRTSECLGAGNSSTASGLALHTGSTIRKFGMEKLPMSTRIISRLSAIALLAITGGAVAQEGGKAPTPGAAPGNAGAAQMAPNSPGAASKSSPAPSSEKGAASEQPSMKGAEKAPSNGQKNAGQRGQASDKGKPGQPSTAEKNESGATPENRAAKEDKEKSSSGASTGEQGKANTSTEAGTKTSVSLSQEQRSKVQSAFKGHASAKVDIRIDARAGVAVPRDVVLVAIPEDVVVIVPEWRRYKFIVIGDHICIVDPDTYVIVDVIAAV